MNPKIFFHNTTFSVQLPYIAGHSLSDNILNSVHNYGIYS